MRALEPVGVQGASLAELATQQAHQDGEDAMRVKVTPLMELREEKEKCWAGKLQRARLRGTTYDCKRLPSSDEDYPASPANPKPVALANRRRRRRQRRSSPIRCC